MLANCLGLRAPPDCEECPACEAESVHSGVIAPTTIWSPGWKRLTAAPTWWTTPTASCPRVRFSRGPIAPLTVCTSEVQMRALVVLTMASVGPGVGIGLSANPTLPIPFITKARIAVHLQSGSPGTCCGYAMSDARVRYAMSSTRYGDAREESR